MRETWHYNPTGGPKDHTESIEKTRAFVELFAYSPIRMDLVVGVEGFEPSTKRL